MLINRHFKQSLHMQLESLKCCYNSKRTGEFRAKVRRSSLQSDKRPVRPAYPFRKLRQYCRTVRVRVCVLRKRSPKALPAPCRRGSLFGLGGHSDGHRIEPAKTAGPYSGRPNVRPLPGAVSAAFAGGGISRFSVVLPDSAYTRECVFPYAFPFFRSI